MSAAAKCEWDEQQYNWPVPPVGGWTAEDLDELPGLPPHTELIDGSLVTVSPQTMFHMLALRLLETTLVSDVPEEMFIFRELTVELGKRDRPEPDIAVAWANADTGPRGTRLLPEDVVLAVEVVSEDSEQRDRRVKPHKYAQAGIPHFWRVESDDGLPVVYVYELDPATKAYVPTGIFHDEMKLTVPFPLAIDLTSMRRPRAGSSSTDKRDSRKRPEGGERREGRNTGGASGTD